MCALVVCAGTRWVIVHAEIFAARRCMYGLYQTRPKVALTPVSDFLPFE